MRLRVKLRCGQFFVPFTKAWRDVGDRHCLCKNSTVAQGWKPGAVSRVLLRKLNLAKHRTSAVTSRTQMKRSKKKTVDKPLLIISKKQGQYSVEMQTTELNNADYKPLVYKIASANNEEKIRRRERREKLLEERVQKGWGDPYNPEICETKCLRAYMESCGYYGDVPDDNESEGQSYEGSCSEEHSSDDSLDVDWEIHFTPPIVRHKDKTDNSPTDVQ